MSLSIEPLEETDIPRYVRLELEAFRSHPRIPMLWRRGYTDDLYAFYEDSKTKSYNDPQCRFMKAVDEKTGDIIAVSQWTFALDVAKNAEAEAKRNVKIAEEAAKAKGIFLANVSHELRTPLNGVIGNSELLRDSNLNREQLEMADSIRVSAELLLTVINDILDFSKMEADKMKLYITHYCLWRADQQKHCDCQHGGRVKGKRNTQSLYKLHYSALLCLAKAVSFSDSSLMRHCLFLRF